MKQVIHHYKQHFLLYCVIGLLPLFFTSCEKALNLDSPDNNKVAVFDELWKVMDEHYALFPVKKTDWHQCYLQYHPAVQNNMSDHDFFVLLSNMLDSLKDGHVSLVSSFDTYTYDGFYKLYPQDFNYNNLVNFYLHNDYLVKGPLIYKIVDSIGYLYYNSFSYTISDAELDDVMRYMQASKGLIIDVRNNNGGNSENADRFFSHFINERKLVKYELVKKGASHTDFFDARPYYIDPAGTVYNKPIALLTNRSCFSTCNDFASYMASLPNVKLFGDQTGGGGSIPYDYMLANGWKLQYSATLTLDASGLPVEDGIQPDELIHITPIQEANGIDPIIDAAFQYLY